jgi:hypothetical protein
MLSIYIPVVLSGITEEFVQEVFETHNIGTVSHVDMVFNGKKYSAYVHFSEWKYNHMANELEAGKSCRVYFDYPRGFEYKSGYWICLKNKSTKCNYLTPKVRIDVSGLQEEAEEVDEEAEEMSEETEEMSEETEEFEEENAWMDDLMEKDADTESEAWDFMMEELSREEEEKALATANYVQELEGRLMYLQHILDMSAWERMQLMNTVAHLENVANELYYTNRSLSGFLQYRTRC